MAVRMRKVLAIPQSRRGSHPLDKSSGGSGDEIGHTTELCSVTIAFRWFINFFVSPSSCKHFIFTCIQFISVFTASANDILKISNPHQKNNGPSLKSISIGVSSDKSGCNAGYLLSQSLRSKTTSNYLFNTTGVSISCSALDTFVS